MGYGAEVAKEGGFSLIEMMVVIAIFGIMALIAAPNLRRAIRLSELKQGAQLLYSTLYRARSEAVRTAADCTIEFNTATASFASQVGNFCVVPIETLPNGINFGGNPVASGNPITFPQDATDSDIYRVSFNFLGGSENGTVFMINQFGDRMSVVISVGGRIDTRIWNGSSFN